MLPLSFLILISVVLHGKCKSVNIITLIPGVTDDEEDLLKLKELIQSLKSVKKVELLPYHNLREHKWKKLGFEYKLKNIRPANSDDIERAKKILDIWIIICVIVRVIL